MLLKFQLTMPNNNSWNGKDSGGSGKYLIFRKVDKEQSSKLLGTNHYYNFEDGWGSNIEITNDKKCKSDGFRGYDWMVDEILKFGRILDRAERIQMRKDNTYPFR